MGKKKKRKTMQGSKIIKKERKKEREIRQEERKKERKKEKERKMMQERKKESWEKTNVKNWQINEWKSLKMSVHMKIDENLTTLTFHDLF